VFSPADYARVDRRQRSRRETQDTEFRTLDGSGNNVSHPEANAAGAAYARLAPVRFADGTGEMVGGANPRTIGNLVVGEGEAATPNGQGLSGM